MPAPTAPRFRARKVSPRRKPGPPLGPEPVQPDGSVSVRLRNSERVARVSVEDYQRVMAYRWSLDKDGYAATTARKCVNGHWRAVRLAMHRLIARAPARLFVDHKNGDRLDNRRCNLRRATPAENSRAFRTRADNASSVYRGVTWHRQCAKWQAAIKVGNVSHYLGLYADEWDAARAYNTAARKFFGRFACLNVRAVGAPEVRAA